MLNNDLSEKPQLPLNDDRSIPPKNEQSPWVEFAGMFENDPDFAVIAAAMRAERSTDDDTEVDPSVMKLVGEIISIVGIAGILLSTMAIVSGFGLRKMKNWGYICSYITIISYTLMQIFLLCVSGKSSLNLPIVASISTSIAIAIGLIKNKIPT